MLIEYIASAMSLVVKQIFSIWRVEVHSRVGGGHHSNIVLTELFGLI